MAVLFGVLPQEGNSPKGVQELKLDSGRWYLQLLKHLTSKLRAHEDQMLGGHGPTFLGLRHEPSETGKQATVRPLPASRPPALSLSLSTSLTVNRASIEPMGELCHLGI